MAVLQLLGEETIAEERLEEYFQDLYRIVCVAERPASVTEPAGLVRTTYIVDWEQLVHLLEGYSGFGEDIVEVAPVDPRQARRLDRTMPSDIRIARA